MWLEIMITKMMVQLRNLDNEKKYDKVFSNQTPGARFSKKSIQVSEFE